MSRLSFHRFGRSPRLRRGIKPLARTRSIPWLSQGLLAVLVITLALPAVAQDEADDYLRAAAKRSVAVATILDAPLNTPEQRLQAVFAMVDLGETQVAGALLAPLLAAELDDQSRAGLVREFGTARFLRLARLDRPVSVEDLGPVPGARKFALACLEAATRLARDPARIDELIEQLNAAKAEDRKAAIVDLAVTGTAGGKACLEALAGETEPELRANIMRAIVRLRPEVDPQLMAVLADGEGLLLRDVAEIAGHTGMLDAAPLLAAIAVRSDVLPETQATAQKALIDIGLSYADTVNAQELVLSEIRRLENTPKIYELADDGKNQWWDFDPAAKQLSGTPLPERHSKLAQIHRLARVLADFPTATESDRQLALLYAMQFAKKMGRPISPDTKRLTEELSGDSLSLTLGEALSHNQAAAAIACAELLGQRKDIVTLLSVDGRPTSLAKALQHPHRDVRFAALEAIMAIQPQQTFAGASYLPKALWEFAGSAGPPQAIAASSVVAKASDWAGQLRGLGYDAIGVASGRDALRFALKSPRLTLLLVDSEIDRPALREVLYQLRKGRTTAQVPVAILSSSPDLAESLDLAELDPLLLASPRPHRQGDFAAIVEQLHQLHPSKVDEASRLEQSEKALGWIAALQEQGHPYDEFHRGSDVVGSLLFNAKLSGTAMKTLATLASAASQEALVDYASNSTASMENRRAAAAAFEKSVERFGIMLSPTQVHHQYDRYNASETADRETQKLLGRLLDVLERKPTDPPST